MRRHTSIEAQDTSPSRREQKWRWMIGRRRAALNFNWRCRPRNWGRNSERTFRWAAEHLAGGAVVHSPQPEPASPALDPLNGCCRSTGGARITGVEWDPLPTDQRMDALDGTRGIAFHGAQ